MITTDRMRDHNQRNTQQAKVLPSDGAALDRFGNSVALDGDTAVIGGIYTRNTGRNVDQVPFLGDIPVLGVFFKRRRFREDRNELLIFLTPRIVNRALALPE